MHFRLSSPTSAIRLFFKSAPNNQLLNNMTRTLLVVSLFSFGQSANILGVFPYPSESHHLLGSALLGNLAKRGHNVTYISPFKNKIFYPNFTHLVIEDMLIFQQERIQKYLRNDLSFLDNIERIILRTSGIQDIMFKNPKIKHLLNSNSTYDLIIHFLGIDASIAFANHFDAPIIVFVPYGGLGIVDTFGNPAPTAYVPNALLPFSDDMNFWQRLENAMSDLIFVGVRFILTSFGTRNIQKYFPGAASFVQIKDRVQLTFVNSHVSTETPRPYVPSMVQIGGFHLQEPEPLPADLRQILDEATNGVVYFSLGTNVKVSDIANDKLAIIMSALGNLSMKILLKSDMDTIQKKPGNVEVRTWFPQRGILSHPNVKVFISHGGYGSSTETLYYGVPMICIPFYSDQPKNCADVERHGYGINLPMKRLTPGTFAEALRKALHDEKLISTTKLKSDLYRDQEMNPMDRASYWVNHVIKHKGAKHLRVKALDLAWYQYYLLDVIAFISCVVVIFVMICYYVLIWCSKAVYCKWEVKIKYA